MWLEYICMFCYITYMYIPHSPITSGGPFLSDGPLCSSPWPTRIRRWKFGGELGGPVDAKAYSSFLSLGFRSHLLNQWPFQEISIDPSVGVPNPNHISMTQFVGYVSLTQTQYQWSFQEPIDWRYQSHI